MGKLRTTRVFVTAALVVTGLAVLGPADPAGATAGASFAGDTYTVTLTGAEAVNVACVGGVVQVSASNPVPSTTPCTSVRHLVVNGDGGAQFVILFQVTAAGFPNLVNASAVLGAGDDVLYTS